MNWKSHVLIENICTETVFLSLSSFEKLLWNMCKLLNNECKFTCVTVMSQRSVWRTDEPSTINYIKQHEQSPRPPEHHREYIYQIITVEFIYKKQQSD